METGKSNFFNTFENDGPVVNYFSFKITGS